MFHLTGNLKPSLLGYRFLIEVLSCIVKDAYERRKYLYLFRQYIRTGHKVVRGARKDPKNRKFWIVPNETAKEIITYVEGKAKYIGVSEMANLVGCASGTIRNWIKQKVVPVETAKKEGSEKVLRETFMAQLSHLKRRLKMSKFIKWGEGKKQLTKPELAAAMEILEKSREARKNKKNKQRKKRRHKASTKEIQPKIDNLMRQVMAVRRDRSLNEEDAEEIERKLLIEHNRLRRILNDMTDEAHQVRPGSVQPVWPN